MRYSHRRADIRESDWKVTEEEKEQKMMEELAEFVLKFNAKYEVLMDIKIKSMKVKKDIEKGRRFK